MDYFVPDIRCAPQSLGSGTFGTAEFHATGFEESSREVRTHPAGRAQWALGEVRLRPTP